MRTIIDAAQLGVPSPPPKRHCALRINGAAAVRRINRKATCSAAGSWPKINPNRSSDLRSAVAGLCEQAIGQATSRVGSQPVAGKKVLVDANTGPADAPLHPTTITVPIMSFLKTIDQNRSFAPNESKLHRKRLISGNPQFKSWPLESIIAAARAQGRHGDLCIVTGLLSEIQRLNRLRAAFCGRSNIGRQVLKPGRSRCEILLSLPRHRAIR